MTIQYTKGDATQPTGTGHKIIVHICNDIGGWGKGFVLAISKRWPQPEQQYRAWAQSKAGFVLGAVQFVEVEPGLTIANVIGQHKLGNDEQGAPPIRYDAVREGLSKVSTYAAQENASVHMPRIGCGLAGGTWDRMEPIIDETLTAKGIPVTVYDF